MVTTSGDSQDVVPQEIRRGLTDGFDDGTRDRTYGSAVFVLKDIMKSGDHVPWEIMMNPIPSNGALWYGERSTACSLGYLCRNPRKWMRIHLSIVV